MTTRKRTRAHHRARTHSRGPSLRDELAYGSHETKTIQLARQVEEALSMALSCATSARLQALTIAEVVPLRGAALMRVVLEHIGGTPHDEESVYSALSRASGYLRGEVARAIHRKRVPNFEFVLLPANALAEPEEDPDDR